MILMHAKHGHVPLLGRGCQFSLVAKTEYLAQKKAWQKRLKESANILGSYVLQPTQNLFPNTMTLYTIRSSCQLQTKLDSPSESTRDE